MTWVPPEVVVQVAFVEWTDYGLLRHATQISGSTLFLPDPTILPLRDVPILGKLTSESTDEQIGRVPRVRHHERW